MTKTERALKIRCPRCNAAEGEHCSLVYLTESDPFRSERHAMNRCHKERYIESVGVKGEA